jgi:hypothetical protein
MNAGILCDPKLLSLRRETLVGPLYPASELILSAGRFAVAIVSIVGNAPIFVSLALGLGVLRVAVILQRPSLISTWMNCFNTATALFTLTISAFAANATWRNIAQAPTTAPMQLVISAAVGAGFFGFILTYVRYFYFGTMSQVLRVYNRQQGLQQSQAATGKGSSSTVPNQFVSKCRTFTDVEVLARTCLDRGDIDEVLMAVNIFEAGLDRFPNHPKLLMAYARFVLFVIRPLVDEQLNRKHEDIKIRCISQLNSVLKNLEAMHTPLDCQYFIFYIRMTLDLNALQNEVGKAATLTPLMVGDEIIFSFSVL